MKKPFPKDSEVIEDILFKGNGVLLLLKESQGECLISKEDYLLDYYYPGKELNADSLRILKKAVDNKKAKDYLSRYLLSSSYTREEAKRKLKDKFSLSDADCDALLLPYIQQGLFDDKEYALGYIEEKKGNGYGNAFVLYQLSQKGISKEILDSPEVKDALAKEDYDAILLLSRHMLRLADKLPPIKKKEKIHGYLLRRGFSSSEARVLMEALFQEDDETQNPQENEIQSKEMKAFALKCYNSIQRKEMPEAEKKKRFIRRLLSQGYRYEDIEALLAKERYFSHD